MNASVIRLTSAAAGSAAILFGLQRRGPTKTLSLAAGVGLFAYGVLAKPSNRESDPGDKQRLSIKRVITVGKPRDEVYRRWSDPQVLSKVFGGTFEVSSQGGGRIRVRTRLPAGHEIAWTSQLVERDQDASLLWRTDPGAAIPHEIFVRFLDARPAELGTEVTLGFTPLPGSSLSKALVSLTRSVDQAMLTKALRRFKSLVETGEVPTLSRNPAARHRAINAA